MYKFAVAVLLVILPGSVFAQLHVFACEPEWAALVSELTDKQATIYTATNAMQDPHYIQARPALISKLRRADLLICTGAGLEAGWLPILLRRAGNSRVQAGRVGHFMASEFVKLQDKPEILDRSLGDLHADGDPHFHTNPENMLLVSRALSVRLQKLLPTSASIIQSRTTRFINKWTQSIARWKTRARPLQGQPIITQHKSWSYLLRWLGLKEVIQIESKPGIPPGAAHLGRVVVEAKRYDVKVVIRTPYDNAEASQWLHEQTGIKPTVLPYTVGGTEQATNLFNLFDETIRILCEAYQQC